MNKKKLWIVLGIGAILFIAWKKKTTGSIAYLPAGADRFGQQTGVVTDPSKKGMTVAS
jgi:hypothetical protein